MADQVESQVMLPTYDTLLLDIAGAIATITLNRPEVLNALNARMFDDLAAVLTLLRADPSVRVVVLTGSGTKAFAAGADISELAETNAASGEVKALRGQAVFQMMEDLGRPVVGGVNGYALGGGAELAMACTIRVAADTARMGLPEVKLGLLPGYGGTQRLPRLVGRSAALRLLLTGEMITASEALRLGLVDEVVPAGELMARVTALATQIAEQAPLAVAACLEAVNEGMKMDLQEGLKLEATLFGQLSGTEDKKDGVAAFLEKRKPVWRGR